MYAVLLQWCSVRIDIGVRVSDMGVADLKKKKQGRTAAAVVCVCVCGVVRRCVKFVSVFTSVRPLLVCALFILGNRIALCTFVPVCVRGGGPVKSAEGQMSGTQSEARPRAVLVEARKLSTSFAPSF